MAKMKVAFEGKNYTVPKETIELYMDKLELTQEESIQLYLEEEGKLVNEEYEEANADAEQVARKFTQVSPKKEKKERKPREKKEDPIKEGLINELCNLLKSNVFINEEGCFNVQITNSTKIVEFDMFGEHYKLDLIRTRKK